MNQPVVTDGTPSTFLLVTGNQVVTHFYASAVDLHETTWITDVPIHLEKINYAERLTDIASDYVHVQLTFPQMSALDVLFDAESATAAGIHKTVVKSIPIGLNLPGNTKIVVRSWQQNLGDMAFVQIYGRIIDVNEQPVYQGESPCDLVNFITGRCHSR